MYAWNYFIIIITTNNENSGSLHIYNSLYYISHMLAM